MSNDVGFIIFWLAIGLVAGAWLDLLIRLVEQSSDLVEPGCSCQFPRVDLRLIPLFGAARQLRCSRCARGTGYRVLALQLVTAIAFGMLAWRFPVDRALVIYSAYALILAVVFVTDLDHRLIFNAVTYPSMAASLIVGGLLYGQSYLGGLRSSLVGGLFTGALFFFLYLLAGAWYRRTDALGLGDVKLALLIGLMVGWPNAVAAILLGLVAGGIFGLFLIVKHRSAKSTMPYGTALSLGALISILWLRPAV